MRISDWSSDVCSSDLHINQRLMHIRRKIGCIATHIDMCAIFQPIEQLTAAFPHALLNIDFFRAIARESDIHPVKHPVLQPGLPFALIQRSEEHTSELQSLMRISYAVFCLKKKKIKTH